MTDSTTTLLVSYGLAWLVAGIAAALVFKPRLPSTAIMSVAIRLSTILNRSARALFTVPRFGPALESYRESGFVSLKAKRIALLAAWSGLALCSMAFANGGMLTLYAIAALGVTLTMLIGRLPTERDAEIGSYSC